MATEQNLKSMASGAYEDAIELIEKTGDLYRRTAEPTWRVSELRKQFDLILQAILLSSALADGRFDRLEREFISGITRHADLLDFLNRESGGKLSLRWETIAGLPADTQAHLVKLLPSVLGKLCDAFVYPMAKIDADLKRIDVFEILVEKIADIAYALAGVDGNAEKCEGDAATAMCIQLLKDRWSRIAIE